MSYSGPAFDPVEMMDGLLAQSNEVSGAITEAAQVWKTEDPQGFYSYLTQIGVDPSYFGGDPASEAVVLEPDPLSRDPLGDATRAMVADARAQRSA